MPIKSQWTIPIPDTSLASLLFTSPTHPLSTTKPALLDADDPSKYLTPHTYRLWSQRLAAGLLKYGFRPGDRLLLFSGNNIFFPVIFMGVVMAGGIFTGANPGYIARELAYQLENSGAVFLLCAAGSLDIGLDAASQIAFPKARIFVFDDAVLSDSSCAPTQGCQHWSKLVATVEEGEECRWDPCNTAKESEKTIALNYSSGTTGVPKGVEITHKNYVANSLQVQYVFNIQDDAAERLITERWLCFLPMYHAYAQTFFVAGGALQGVPVYVMPKFDFEKMLDHIQRYRITYLTMVPPIVVAMAKHPDVRRGKWDLSSIRVAGSGAAPLGKEISEEFDKLFLNRPEEDRIVVKQGWGMTEATCSVIGASPSIDPAKSVGSSIGVLYPNCEAKIMNDEGTAELKTRERGELWIRAPNVMKGYWRNEKATKETLTPDGWLRTGDVAYVNDEGFFYIVDRKKELIKVKGNQVAPAELEALLLDHPAVADAAVVGVEKDGEEYPRAYIVLNVGHQATEDDIVKFMDQRVSRMKRITGGVRFIDMIPKNPSGKILRKFLRDRAKNEDKLASPKL